MSNSFVQTLHEHSCAWGPWPLPWGVCMFQCFTTLSVSSFFLKKMKKFYFPGLAQAKQWSLGLIRSAGLTEPLICASESEKSIIKVAFGALYLNDIWHTCVLSGLVAMGNIYLYVVSEFTLSPDSAYSQELGPVDCWVHMACKKSPNSSKHSIMRRITISPNLIQSLLVPSVGECWLMGHHFWLQTECFLLVAAGPAFRSTWCPAHSAWAEPHSAGSGWIPAFPTRFWDEAIQQLAEESFQPVCPAFQSCPGLCTGHVLRCLSASHTTHSGGSATTYIFCADSSTFWQDLMNFESQRTPLVLRRSKRL